MAIRKIKASYVNLDLEEYVGESTYIFYDTVTGELRMWDGTPGGFPLLGGGGSGSWGGITGTITTQTDLIALVDNYILLTEKAAINGVATLDGSGTVPAAQLPAYVDDVLDYANVVAFPVTGEMGKIYIDASSNDAYRWTGTGYASLSSLLLHNQQDYIAAFIGKDTHNIEPPSYSSSFQLTQNNDLEGAIGELDLAIGIDLVGNTIITTGDPTNEAIQDLADYVETNNQVINITNVTTITTVDSVLGDVAKWLVRIEEAATPANVYAAEMIAVHNGTDSDTSKYAIIELGAKIAGLAVTVTLTGGNTLNINVAATPAVNVTVKRIMVV